MKQVRKMIRIEEDKCNGCGECIPNCPEGALQIIDGKARLVSDLFCDGLGACVGHCPTGALRVEEREAEPYSEAKVMENIVRQGPNTIAAHLAHLKEHGAMEYYRQAVDFLKKHNVPVPGARSAPVCSCPSSQATTLERTRKAETGSDEPQGNRARASELSNWPVQISLVPVSAPYLRRANLLIAADCVAAAYPSFHEDFVAGKVLLMGCPKLDDAAFYEEKLAELFRTAEPASVTVAHMEVPCCFGLVQLVRQAIAASGKTIPLAEITVTIRGEIDRRQRTSRE